MALTKIVNGKRISITSKKAQDIEKEWADIDNKIKEDKIARLPTDVKSVAHKKIVAILPEWKQRNQLARTLELLDKKSAGSALTVEEQSEVDDIRAQWGRVQAIRSYSDTLEDELARSEDPLSVDINSGWPE